MEGAIISKHIDILRTLINNIKSVRNYLNQNEQIQLDTLINGNDFHLLLADDDEDDRTFFIEAVESVAPAIKVTTVNDGVKLLKSLESLGDKLPDLIFLDLNMPFKNGFECLEAIRSKPKWKNIPVLIYSTSAHEEQIEQTYQHGANLYIQKPDSFEGIKNMLKKLFSFNLQRFFVPPPKEYFFLK